MFMELFIYLTSALIVLCVLFIWGITTYNKFQSFIIRINEAEASIDSVLRKRFDLLNKSINVIKSNTETEEVLESIVKLRSKKLTNFDLDRQLYEAINEFNGYKESYEALKSCDSFIKIEIALNETEAEIFACRKYYNDIITDYNKCRRSFPSNLIAIIFGYKDKTYFDGKDMNDDIVNDFKL